MYTYQAFVYLHGEVHFCQSWPGHFAAIIAASSKMSLSSVSNIVDAFNCGGLKYASTRFKYRRNGN